MSLIDWLIVVIPTAFIVGVGLYTRKYIHGVVDFLVAGRVCRRYVICTSDVANALSIIGLIAFVEVQYKSGFALAFWQHVVWPLGVLMSLFGYCTYRFRETKAMSLGQFLEMRYNRKFRIFAAALRSVSSILANMIMPAIAARFFIYYLDMPASVDVLGLSIPTFMLVMAICLAIAISLIYMGGTLALIVTDAIQGIFCFPLALVFIGFILYTFSWSDQIVPVMLDRVRGESFLNPYDISNLRDFNLFMVVVFVFTSVFHRASWIGSGSSAAARDPHEQKMAGLLGAWRAAITLILSVLIAIAIITLMNHRDWAPNAKAVRDNISARISQELLPDATVRTEFDSRIALVPAQTHQIGVDPPLSQNQNLDTPILDAALEAFREYEGETDGNAKFAQYRTLYHQMMMAGAMRSILPPVIMGLFCLLMVLAMISTDDTQIFNASLTITQDVIMPLRKTPFSPRQHIMTLRLVAIGVGACFFCGSYYMAQLDYIQLFLTMMVAMWMGGCGPVMIFGLYSRFGTTAGAFASLGSGMLLAFFGIFLQRNWAALVYPWLERMGWVEGVGGFLAAASKPFNPYIVWEMNPIKFPVNTYEFYFITMVISLTLYCVVSWLTMKKPFNLERMLHRGIYNLDGDKKDRVAWSWRTTASKLLGITPAYTAGDKTIAWGFFLYCFVYHVLIAFVMIVVWNMISPWPEAWWGTYFFLYSLLIPAILSVVSTVWFGIGGTVDLFRLFRDLEEREVNHLDSGWVEGHVSIVDKAAIDELEKESTEIDETA